MKGVYGRFYSKKGDKKGLNERSLAMPRSDEAPRVAARTVNAWTTRDGRERGADVDARARFAISPVCGHAANARRLEVVERRENAVQVDAVPGGPRGTRRRRLWQRRAAVRPRTAPKRRQKDVKTRFSPLARRGRVHEPLRRRRRPRTRQVRGVERLRSRGDPPGVRRAGLGRTASTLRADPRFVAKTSAHHEKELDLDPYL